MSRIDHSFYPNNRLYRIATVETVDAVTGETDAITTGSVSAFIANTNDPNAAAADGTLNTSAVHVGVAVPVGDQLPLGSWLVTIPASTSTLLDSLFNNTGKDPYLIVQRTSESRVYEKLKYVRARKADFG